MGGVSEERLPSWVSLVRAPNPGVMTLDGTNTYVLSMPGETVVVDPGPLDEAHLSAVASLGTVDTVLVTHGHPDHVEGLPAFLELTGARLGSAANGVTRLPTPGHTADSVCFVAERDGQRVVLTGDTILGRGSTVVAYPDGDLGAYLESLGALTAYSCPGLPGHGPVLDDCGAAARAYLEHRRQRLEQVRAAVAGGARDAAAVVAVVYADVDPALWPAAEQTVRAQLRYLGT